MAVGPTQLAPEQRSLWDTPQPEPDPEPMRALWRYPESVGRSLVRLAPAAALLGVVALATPYLSIRSWYTTGDLVAFNESDCKHHICS